jgi:Ca-activated chloride channel family protein
MNRKISLTLLSSMLLLTVIGCEDANSTSEDAAIETTKQELAAHDALATEKEEATVQAIEAPANEAERARELAEEVQDKTLLQQVGTGDSSGADGALVDVLSEDAPSASADEAFQGSTGVGDNKKGKSSKGLDSKLLGNSPLKNVFGDQEGFNAKMNVAMSGEGGELVVGRGAGGMGMRAVGPGTEGFGRVGGVARGGGGISERGVGLGSVGRGSYGKGVKIKGPTQTVGGRVDESSRRHRAQNSGVLAYRSSHQGAPSVSQPAQPAVPFAESAGNESYKDHGVNPMTDTKKDRFSTFAIDVDTGAYTIARRKLKEGHTPPAASVRVEEFINYFSYNYPNPDSGPFGVNLEAAPSPFSVEKDRYLVRVGVQGKRVAQKDRKPVHLTFLVDVSGSMNRPDKLGLAKESLKILTRNLKRGDTVALATYAGNTRVVLTPTSNKTQILDAIDNLRSGGGTAMSSGMELAYKQALSSYKKGHVNRVIVLSDGDANIGRTSFEDILSTIKSYVDEGVTLSTIGFGMGNYKDSLMEQLANKGNGNYYYIDDIKEARKVFGEQIDGTLEVIAKDVKIQVEFNPDAVSKYRLIGYENRDIADKDFRNDAVDAGEIGAGHSVTALYEVVMDPGYKGSLAFVRVRHKEPEGHKASEQIFMLNAGSVATKLSDASKDFQFAAAVAGFAEILRGSKYSEHLTYALVEEIAHSASSPSQKDRQEFISLVRKAKAM